MIDEWRRGCLAIEVDTSLTGAAATRVLQRVSSSATSCARSVSSIRLSVHRCGAFPFKISMSSDVWLAQDRAKSGLCVMGRRWAPSDTMRAVKDE